jgi:hypothetical protein
MKNLNKFRKSELINKIKMLDKPNNNNNKSILIRIVEYILLFKSLILKLTLLAFIIRWFKKYSLLKKLWYIFSWVATTLVGISLIDIYSLDIFNWIKETNIYKWLYELFNSEEISKPIKEVKSVKEVKTVKEDGEFQFPKKITNQTDGNETRHVTFSEWLNRNTNKEIIKDESLFDKIKDNSKTILIISGVVIVSSLSWYYSNEIKEGFGTSIEWIKNYLFGPSSDPGTDSTKGDILNSTKSSKDNFKERFLKIISSDNESNSKISEIDLKGKGKLEYIETVDFEDIELENKGKSILTSPSLESLNNRASDAWSESRSPQSDSSSSTITPENYKNESFEQIQVISKIWRGLIPEESKISVSYIESVFSSKEELTLETSNKLVKELTDVIWNYDKQVELYNIENAFNLQEREQYKLGLYQFKKWISEYYSKILPNELPIEIGNIKDDPVKLSKYFKNN